MRNCGGVARGDAAPPVVQPRTADDGIETDIGGAAREGSRQTARVVRTVAAEGLVGAVQPARIGHARRNVRHGLADGRFYVSGCERQPAHVQGLCSGRGCPPVDEPRLAARHLGGRSRLIDGQQVDIRQRPWFAPADTTAHHDAVHARHRPELFDGLLDAFGQ